MEVRVRVRVEVAQVGVAQAEGGQVAGAPALHDDVHLGNQALEDGPAGGSFQVQGRALLVQVQDQEEEAPVRVGVVVVEGAHAAEGRAAGGFQLQDVGAIVGQQAGAKGAGDVLAQVQNLYPLECAGQHWVCQPPINQVK